jgi:Cu/Ag efflux pump CusA
MRRPKTVVLISVLVTAPTIAAGFYEGSDFMPKLDEGAFMCANVIGEGRLRP